MKRVQFPPSSAEARLLREKRLLFALSLCGLTALHGCGPATWKGGVHARLAWSERGVRVIDVPPSGPAARADVRPGDQLVAVDGKPLDRLSAEQVQQLLAGEVGSIARLEVLREGAQHTLEVEREPYAKGAGE